MAGTKISKGFVENLKTKGYKLTSQRRAILDILLKHSGEHLNSEEIYNLVKGSLPTIGIATVYRTLPLLEQMGYLSRVILDDGFIRYEVRQDEPHFHHHLICTNCGAVSEIQVDMLDELEEQVAKSTGFTVKNHSVKFYGICKQCNQA